MILRFAAVAVFCLPLLLAQSDLPVSAPEPEVAASSAPASISRLHPDLNDPLVVRARERAEQIGKLVSAGALPPMRLRKAQEDIQDALDLSLLKQSLYATDLLPDEADQMVDVAHRMVIRRQRNLLEMQQLVGAGIISRSEAETTNADLARAQEELELAESRASLVQQLATSARIQKEIASLEVQAESHPEWAGQIYTHFEGSGVFTHPELEQLESDYAIHFAKPLPISAEGETALHRSLGFDHRGRVDVAVTPDQPEGQWLMHYLEAKGIPYFAFRTAVPHKATGAHIHVGPSSTRLAVAY